MASLPRYLLFLLSTCLAWGCNLNDESLTGEEQALCFLTVLRHVRERLNEANREREFSSEDLDNSGEESNDFVGEGDDDDGDVTGAEEDAKFASKRGKLDQNFLRFGRLAVKTPSDSWKRAALDRNFLRFGRSTDGARNKRAAEVMSDPEMRFASGYQSENVFTAVPSQRSVNYGDKGILSPQKLHLIRELSRKRGALERNFLRFGRSGEEHEDHHLEKRAALDRNFLRFGRREDYEKKAALDRNFLRFGRNSHHDVDMDENFVDAKRAALDRNFLRFGKKDTSFDQSHYDEVKDEDVKRAALDRNFLRFGRKPSKMNHMLVEAAKRAQLDRNFLRFGKRSWEAETEDGDEADDAARDLISALHQKRDESHQEGSLKRGALDKNFLRFGRRPQDVPSFSNNLHQSMTESSKRAALDRNFLRFGKRNEKDMSLQEDNSHLEPHTGQGESTITMTLSP